MSDNDTPINPDNPQVPNVPIGADVVTLDRVEEIRNRLAVNERTEKAKNLGIVPMETESIPDEQNFEVVLRDLDGVGPGITLNFKGYLVATSVFVGFADGEGIIGSMVPMDRVLYVRSVDVK